MFNIDLEVRNADSKTSATSTLSNKETTNLVGIPEKEITTTRGRKVNRPARFRDFVLQLDDVL